MSWSQGFINALRKNSTVFKYELRFHDNPKGPGGSLSIFGGYGPSMSSPDDLMIARDGPRISGTSITPQTWNVSFGGFSVPIVGDVRKYFPTIMRGAFAALYVEVDGFKERVAFGQLRTISGSFGIYQFGFVDLVNALAITADATIDPSFALERFRWFYRTGNTTTLSTHYTGGTSTIRLTDASNCEKEFGQDGWIKIESSANPTCYATWRSKSVNDLTATTETQNQDVIYPGVNAIPSLSTTGTTTITPMALLQGKPWDILGKLLISRSGTNTHAFDTYPESWSAQGNLPEDIYDYNDAKRAENYVISNPAGTSYQFWIPIEAPWSSGFRSFVDVAAKTGQWPVWRQDAVTWRGARVLNDPNIVFDAEIHTSDIIEIASHDLFDPQTPNVYSFMQIAYQERLAGTEYKTFGNTFATSSNIIETLPTLPVLGLDNKFTYRSADQVSADTNRQAMAFGDIDRLLAWSTAPIEKIVLRLPLQYAKLCAGDFVKLVTQAKFIHGYRDQPGLKNIAKSAMVTATSYNFQDAVCTVTLSSHGFMGDQS